MYIMYMYMHYCVKVITRRFSRENLLRDSYCEILDEVERFSMRGFESFPI